MYDSTDVPRTEYWKHDTRKLYEANFILPPHTDHPVRLVGFPADDILCINVLATNVSPRSISLKSMAVDCSNYVPRYCVSKIINFPDSHALFENGGNNLRRIVSAKARVTSQLPFIVSGFASFRMEFQFRVRAKTVLQRFFLRSHEVVWKHPETFPP